MMNSRTYFLITDFDEEKSSPRESWTKVIKCYIPLGRCNGVNCMEPASSLVYDHEKNTPVIIVSLSGNSLEINTNYRLGFNGFLSSVASSWTSFKAAYIKIRLFFRNQGAWHD